MHHRFPGRFPESHKFTPPWLRELDEWEKEPSKEPLEIVFKAMLRVFAGGTRQQPLKAPPQPKIPPDPEAERMIAERKALGLIGKKTTAELFPAGTNPTNLVQEDWENFLVAQPRFPELEWRFAETEAKRIIRESSADAAREQ
jgi:hypothetical protein